MQIQDTKNTASSTEPVDFSSPSLSLNAEELRSFLHKAVQHLQSALPQNNNFKFATIYL